MASTNFTVIALAPSRQCIGIAVFSGFKLVHFSRKTFRGQKLIDICTRAIPELIEHLDAEYAPSAIVVKAQSKYQTGSTILRTALQLIEQEATRRRITFAAIAISEVTQLLRSPKGTLKDSFRCLSEQYPELNSTAGGRGEEKYYRNLLSAVSVGFVYLKTYPRTRRDRAGQERSSLNVETRRR